MILYTILIPVVTCFILFVFFRKQTTYWEYVVVLVPSLIMAILLNTIMIHYTTHDTMYKSTYIDHVRFYESWNKYIHKTCTRKCGKTTIWYNCDYVRNYPEYETMVDNNNKEYDIYKNEYDVIKHKFGTTNTFVEMNRPYFTKDGNMYYNKWNGDLAKSYVITDEEYYENKTQAFHSLFHLEDIDDEEKIKWKLYDYPKVNNYKQQVVLGKNIDQATEQKLQNINGITGSRFNVKLFILFFYDQPQKVAFKQRSYWEGGNKNELIICIGLDSLTGKTTWAQAFSWCDNKDVTEKCEDLFKDGVVPNLNILADDINKNIILYWKVKNFNKDFEYLHVEVTTVQLEIIVFLLLLYNVGISIWVITNEHHNLLDLKKY